MTKFLPLFALLALGLAGCGSSSDSTTEAAPKGPPPNTQTAPPGTPGPQERTLGNAKDQDGGGKPQ